MNRTAAAVIALAFAVTAGCYAETESAAPVPGTPPATEVETPAGAEPGAAPETAATPEAGPAPEAAVAAKAEPTGGLPRVNYYVISEG